MQPELAGLMVGTLRSFFAGVVAATIVGAAADVLTQFDDMAFHPDDQFSFNELFDAAMDSAVLAVVSGALHIKQINVNSFSSFGEAVLNNEEMVVASQLIQLASGQEKNLSWNAIFCKKTLIFAW